MMKRDEILSLLARFFVGAIYAYAGIIKLIEPLENFRGNVAEYTIIPYAMVQPIALILPWIECVFGFFLLSGYLTRLSGLILSFISLGFFSLIGLSFLLHGTLPASCGCFGQGGIHLSTSQVIFLDAFNFLLGLKLFCTARHPWSLDQFLQP